MDISLCIIIFVAMVVSILLFISNVRMTNRVLKQIEEERARQHWNWN